MSNGTEIAARCFRASYIPYFPWIYLKNSQLEGALLEITKEVIKRNGIKCYEIVRNTNVPFGKLDPENKTFSGIFGRIEKGIYDIFLSCLAFDEIKLKYFDMSHYVYIDGVSALFKYPTLEPNLAGFIMPFHWMTWLGIAISLIIVFLVYAFFSMMDKQSKSTTSILSSEDRKGTVPRKFQTSFFFLILRIILAQNLIPDSKAPTVRIIAGMWVVISLILGLSYKCNLKAMLILPKIKIPFNNFNEMVQQNDMEWYMVEGTVLHRIFGEAPPESLFRKIYDGTKSFPKSYASVLSQAQSGKTSLVVGETIVDGFVNRAFKDNTCTLTKMKQGVFVRPYGLFLSKNSPYTKSYNYVISGFLESGIAQHLVASELPYASECNGNYDKGKPMRPLSLEDFYGVFSLLVGGWTIAFFVFIGEILMVKVFKSRLETSERVQQFVPPN